jgi:hypothetical protein
VAEFRHATRSIYRSDPRCWRVCRRCGMDTYLPLRRVQRPLPSLSAADKAEMILALAPIGLEGLAGASAVDLYRTVRHRRLHAA